MIALIHLICLIGLIHLTDLRRNWPLCLRLFPHASEEVLEGEKHAVDHGLGVAGDLSERLHLLFSLVSEEGEFLSIVLETFSALRGISRVTNPFEDLLHVALYVSFNVVDFDDVLPDVVVLDLCDLSVLVPLLHQVGQVVGFHLLNDLHQPVVESSSQLGLLGVLLLQTAKLLEVAVVVGHHGVAQFQNAHNFLVNGFVLVLWQMGQLVLLADPHSRH